MPDIQNQNNFGAFLPTSFSWELSQLQDIPMDPKLKTLMIRLYQYINLMSLQTIQKDTGLYTLEEFIPGSQFFADQNLNSNSNAQPVLRPIYRKVINFGALPNNTSTSIPHGIIINQGNTLTRLYGAATNSTSTSMIPLPFASPTDADNIQLEMTNTDIIITTGKDQTAYTTCYVVIEIIKQ